MASHVANKPRVGYLRARVLGLLKVRILSTGETEMDLPRTVSKADREKAKRYF
jgi:hypothetical protein